MYAKKLSETSIDTSPPRSAMIDGKFVVGRLPEAYLNSIGYYVLDDTAQPGTPDDGYHMEPRYVYDDAEHPTRVVRTYVQVQDPPTEDPPGVYSKLKILAAAIQGGFADTLIDFIQADRTVEYIWNASNTIEDNEMLRAYLPSVAEALGMTEVQVMAFLDENCRAD